MRRMKHLRGNPENRPSVYCGVWWPLRCCRTSSVKRSLRFPASLARQKHRVGLRLTLIHDRMRIDLAWVVCPDVRLRKAARSVQEKLIQATRDLTGPEVAAVNVLIADVEVETRGTSQASGSGERA
ncbi:MAG: Asp23/Gls24 family envelope stress response protein [Anaerolineae bacterium]|nr:Asp23/Gls24 family envelope stress response protein [Anaerolineae bacterium]